MKNGRLPYGSTFGDYRIEGLIARGGMGQVYLARHLVYGQRVALKVLRAPYHLDPEWHARLDEEGNIGMRLKHPNILAAREKLVVDGRPALVLDLARDGQTLFRVLPREYPNGLELRYALDLFLQVLGGVEYLHRNNIVHGDIKPENVLVEGDHRDPRSWVAKVADFGTVALMTKPVQLDGRPAIIATPPYSSPEHLYGVVHLEVRSDIYCLGLLLHFLLTGRNASNAGTVREAADRVSLPVPIVNLVDVAPAVVSLFQRMVARNPAERHDSVRSVALAVRALRDPLVDPEGGEPAAFDDTLPDDWTGGGVAPETLTVHTGLSAAGPPPSESAVSTEAAHARTTYPLTEPTRRFSLFQAIGAAARALGRRRRA